MRKALFIAAFLLLMVPVAAEAAVLSVDRAERLARAEAQERASQENEGGNIQVQSCSRRSVRTVLCRVAWQYVEEFDRRETVDCEGKSAGPSAGLDGVINDELDDICSLPEERVWRTERRNCTARVSVRNLAPQARRLRVTAVLSGQNCKPFFDNDQE